MSDAADDLASQAEPLAGPDPVAVPLADIPLPPPELRAGLDNSGLPASEVEPDDDKHEVATLDFVGDDLPETRFPLRYPFRWQGELVDAITVRQLSVSQVGAVVGKIQRSGRSPDLFDIYADMTGLPARVLRALPAEDGEPIIGAAFDFLPRLLRPESG